MLFHIYSVPRLNYFLIDCPPHINIHKQADIDSEGVHVPYLISVSGIILNRPTNFPLPFSSNKFMHVFPLT